MKRLSRVLACLLMMLPLFLLFGCKENKRAGLEIVCTIFPQYDWAKNLVAGNDDVSLTLLQDSGVDLHSFQPSAADKVKVISCDLLIYVGGESDEWAGEMLKDRAKNQNMRVVRLLDEADTLQEEGEEDERDEHVFLSLKRAHGLVEAIARELKALDPEHEALYDNNLGEYLDRLDALERDYAEATSAPARRFLLFADRFPFRYLASDYNLEYFAAFSGCSAETEASLSTIRSLAEKADDFAVPYILVLTGSDRELAERIISSTRGKNQKVMFLDSLETVTRKRIEAGASYLDLMRENLNVLKTVLN